MQNPLSFALPHRAALRAANSRPYRVNSSVYLFVGAIINRLCAGSHLPHRAALRRPVVWPPYGCTIVISRRAGRPLPAVQVNTMFDNIERPRIPHM